jgi:putative transposase
LWRYPSIPEAVLVTCLAGEHRPTGTGTEIAGIPMVRPQAAVCDNGMIYVSLAFREGCATLGVDLQLARPRTPTDKPHVERFFDTYESTFACDLPGAKGRDVAARGKHPEDEAVYFVSELEDLTYEWLALYYQRAPSEGNRLSCDPRRDLSPNEMFDEGVARAGFVHVPPIPDLYYALLPRRARKVNQRGVKLFGLWYDGAALEPYRPRVLRAERTRDDRHLIRFDPRDLRHVWFRYPDSGEFATLDWRGLDTTGVPFGDLELAWCKANLLAEHGLRAGEAELEEVLCRFVRRYAADAPAKRAEIKLAKAAVLHQASAARDRGTSKLLAPDAPDTPDWNADPDDIEPMPLFAADQPV